MALSVAPRTLSLDIERSLEPAEVARAQIMPPSSAGYRAQRFSALAHRDRLADVPSLRPVLVALRRLIDGGVDDGIFDGISEFMN